MRGLVLISALLLTDAIHFESEPTEENLISFLRGKNLSDISQSLIEEVVSRNYFEAAGDLVQRAHESGVDLSAPIRNAVSEIRSKLDHLVNLLDPEYWKPQRVPPAFQWTQNDTAIFVQLKYSRRFNAPGAVDVSDLNCTFTRSSMLFSAIGGHSGKRFEYALNLDFFDAIVPEASSWNIGSVGKVAITIVKASASKWPRLLLTNMKIDNMHYWFDYAEQTEKALKGLPSVSESGLTCASNSLWYCPTGGKCVASCSASCNAKQLQVPDLPVCGGPPAFKPKEVSFTDSAADRDSIGGTAVVTLVKEFHRYDIGGFNAYLVKQGEAVSEGQAPVGSTLSVSNVTARIDIPPITVSADTPMEVIVVPFNDFGENRDKSVRTGVADLFVPEFASSVNPVAFTDMEAKEGSIRGLLKFSAVVKTDGATHLVFHWAESPLVKMEKSSYIGEVVVTAISFNLTSATAIPSGASHVLVFAKSAVGESASPVGVWEIADRHVPLGSVGPIRLLSKSRVSFTRVTDESLISGYTVRAEWTSASGKAESRDIEVVPPAGILTFSRQVESNAAVDPPTLQEWRICVYLTNELGIGKDGSCVTIPPMTEKRQEL